MSSVKDMRTFRNAQEITEIEWAEVLRDKKVRVSPHAAAYLTGAQRKAFKEEELIFLVARTVPRVVLLQENGRYAAHYRKPESYRKIIIEVRDNEAVVVTFMNEKELPRRSIEVSGNQ